MFDILKNGSFNCSDDNIIKHHNDYGLLSSLIKIFEEKKISKLCDMGCGNAFYIKKLSELNILCEGYDGNPYTEEITDGFAKVIDLSEKVNLGKKFDCIMSLEVGEHIPVKSENIFIKNLIRHTDKYILLSWAILGQDGDGHVNTRNNEYIITKMKNYGFDYSEKISNFFRISADKWYFKKTLMFFEKTN
jgi:hypothetical protein